MTGATSRAATVRGGGVSRLGRSDRTAVGRWFWEIDRLLLLLVFVAWPLGRVLASGFMRDGVWTFDHYRSLLAANTIGGSIGLGDR